MVGLRKSFIYCQEDLIYMATGIRGRVGVKNGEAWDKAI